MFDHLKDADPAIFDAMVARANASNILTLAQQKYLYSKHPQLREAAEKERAEKAAKAQSESKA